MLEVVEYRPKPKFEISKNLLRKKCSMQFLPESLEELSEQIKFQYGDKTLKVSYLIDIVHNLILKYYFKKDNLFHLSSLILKEKYGHLYNHYMSFLVGKGILKVVKNHQKGKNSRVYKLDESIISSRISRYRNQDQVLLKKYRNAVELIEKEDIQKNDIPHLIKKKLVSDLFFVEIDFAKSIFYLDQTNHDTDIYNRNKYSVECINDKHIFYHFDSYGRMHTNFTILKSFIRKNCLMIEGEETVEIDIKNSQPLFLCKLIEEYGPGIVDPEEYKLFKILTLSGNFYQYMMDNSGIRDRKEMKEIVYRVFFGKNFKTKADTMFGDIFPTVHKFIKSYKKERGNYRVLSHDLQNLESDLIFDKIVGEIMESHPEIRIITVHDSLICRKKYRTIVEDIFNDNLKKEFHI